VKFDALPVWRYPTFCADVSNFAIRSILGMAAPNCVLAVLVYHATLFLGLVCAVQEPLAVTAN